MISLAHAADAASGAVAAAPSASDTFMFNLGMIAVLFLLFYVILIRPQQKRIREQQKTLDSLKKGDRVITAGGLIGKISKLTNDREVEVDLGNNIKVTALRYTLQLENPEDAAPKSAIIKNDDKAA